MNDLKNINRDYLTDEALEKLIAATEAGNMLHPPKDFRNDIISRIHSKRKRKKNLQLFSYSMKIIVATAASLGIVLIVPKNINTQEGLISGYVTEWQGESAQTKRLEAEREREEEKLRKIEEKVQAQKQQEEKEMDQYAQKAEKSYEGNFINQINNQMNEYVNAINSKLNQFIRMEVNLDEKEEE